MPLLTALAIMAPVALRAQSIPRFERPQWESAHWLKGNTHAHTTESDGDASPEYVARWYKSHGYRFLVLSDHNVFTDPRRLSYLTDTSFLLVPGEELTAGYRGKAVHVNGLDLPGVVAAVRDSGLLETVQGNVNAIRNAGGVPHINHPNFLWSLDTAVLQRVRDDKLLEIFNGHPLVHNAGGGDWPGMEEAWDALLTRGKRIYGIAVDDAHHFLGEFAADRSNPGRGWIAVRAAVLETKALMRALEAGHFYASSGVELTDVIVGDRTLEIQITPRSNYKFRTEFIGRNGRVLHTTGANPARFTLTSDEPYVRAKVTNSGGAAAWVQPIFTRP